MPASGEFIDRLADLLVASGFGILGAPTSGAAVQVDFRRDGPEMVLLLSQTGGVSYPFGDKEEYGFQVLVDATTISGAKATARGVYDFLHETIVQEIGGHRVLWLRAIAPPQAIPAGPKPERFQFSTNYRALLVRADE